MNASHRAFAAAALVALAVSCGFDGGLGKPSEPVEPTAADAEALRTLLFAVIDLRAQIDAADALFDRDPAKPLTPDERAQLMGLWAPLIDYQVALDAVRARFRSTAGLDRDLAPRVFTLRFASHSGQLALGMSLVSRAVGKDVFETALDEAAPDYGLQAGLFEQLKDRVLEEHARESLEPGRGKGRGHKPTLASDADGAVYIELAELADTLARDAADIYRRQGFEMTITDWLDAFEELLDGLVFPVQKSVAAWMGDTRVYRQGDALITRAQLDALTPRLEPGDILVERRNWYLSNLGLPGFWPHAELYLGVEADLEAYFGQDAEVAAAFPGGLVAHLKEAFPESWSRYASAAADGAPHRIAEAISEGVVFTSIYEAALADYLGVMRPRLTKLEKARAIARAFGHIGKPYDFDFDFLTDRELVCTELVYKSYQAPQAEGRSLVIPLVQVVGRTTLPANEVVRFFDADASSGSRQLEFVSFLEGIEAEGAAHERDEAAFRATWQRIKWDISQP